MVKSFLGGQRYPSLYCLSACNCKPHALHLVYF